MKNNMILVGVAAMFMSVAANAQKWRNDASYSTRNYKHANKAKVAKEAGLENTEPNAYASRDSKMDDYKKPAPSVQAKNENVAPAVFTQGAVNYKQQFGGRKSSTVKDSSNPVASNE